MKSFITVSVPRAWVCIRSSRTALVLPCPTDSLSFWQISSGRYASPLLVAKISTHNINLALRHTSYLWALMPLLFMQHGSGSQNSDISHLRKLILSLRRMVPFRLSWQTNFKMRRKKGVKSSTWHKRYTLICFAALALIQEKQSAKSALLCTSNPTVGLLSACRYNAILLYERLCSFPKAT